MKKIYKLSIGIVFTILLVGCFGENYQFTPPSLYLSSNSNLKSEELAEANIDWRGESNKLIEKEENDIFALATNQKPMYFQTGEKVDILSEHGDFLMKDLTVTVLQNEQKINLKVNDVSFYLPDEKGEYVIEVNLHTDRGHAQYVGNIVIQ